MKKGKEKEKKKKASVLINDALSKTANKSQPRTPVTQHRANKCEKKRGAAQTDVEEVNEVSSALCSAEGRILGLGGGGGSQWRGRRGFRWGRGRER